MLLITRRAALCILCAFTALGWLWHIAVSERVSPERWNRGEYADAEAVLSGWRAGVCRHAGLCGNWISKGGKGHSSAEGVDGKTTQRIKVPQFVLDYTPYVYLHSEEKFMPGDIGEHLMHTRPYLNYTPITSKRNRPHLSNLADLNKYGEHVYLTSDDDPSNPPSWLRGDRNVPIDESTAGNKDEVGMSAAPGIIIWTQKEGGAIDAFYFYFYSFNLGNTVAGWRFGNHVGDWEHTAVRFVDGEPVSMFFSEHSGGAAYEFGVVEKIGKRPVTYSARGSHANYPTPGVHYYAIPLHLLADHTNKGYLWDPLKNNYLYHYNLETDTLTPDASNLNAPVEWFHYEGRWGDKFYPLNDRRQYRVVGQYHYVNGPTSCKMKNLGRVEICQNEGICVVQPSLTYHLEGVDGPMPDEGDDWLEQLLHSQKHGEEEVTVEFANKAGAGDAEPAAEEKVFPGLRKGAAATKMTSRKTSPVIEWWHHM